VSRINVEESVWSDEPILLAMNACGRDRALGALIRLWRQAQKYWKDGKKPIPKNLYEMSDYPAEFLKFRLSYTNEDGDYFARGSERQFSWLLTDIERARKGGLASAAARKNTVATRDSRGRYVGDRTSTSESTEPDRTGTSVPPNPPPPSPPPPPNTGRQLVAASLRSSTKLSQVDPTQSFENLYNGSNDPWVSCLLKSFDPERPPAALLRDIPKIRQTYLDSLEYFKSELKELYSAAPDDPRQRKKYIAVALKRSIGIYIPQRRETTQ